jgi:hypothetical protein
MNRNLRLGTLTTALLLVAAAMYVEPRPAHAACVCDTGDRFATGCWGKGADCAQAVANFPSACVSAAHDACYNMGYDGACQISSVQDSPYYCWYDAGSGMWVVDGVASFYCRTCVVIDPGPKVP